MHCRPVIALLMSVFLLAPGLARGQLQSAEPQVIELEHKYDTIVSGGNGRYLLLQSKEAQLLYIVDLIEGKLAAQIPNVSPDTQVAAGAAYFVLVLKDRRLIQRWSFETMQRDKIARLTTPEKVGTVVMGANATGIGPLFINGGPGAFYNLETLEPIPVRGKVLGEERWVDQYLSASADGSSIISIASFRGPPMFYRMRLYGDTVETLEFGYHLQHAHRYAKPTADGRLILCRDPLLIDENLQTLQADAYKQWTPFTTPDPRYFLMVRHFSPDRNTPSRTEIKVCTVNERKAILDVHGFPEMAPGQRDWHVQIQDLSAGTDRFFYLPRAGRIANLPHDNRRVLIRGLDLETGLAAGGKDYLEFVSLPPLRAEAGAALAYPLEVLSKHEGLTYNIEDGPEGMGVDAQGVVSWDVPATATGTVDVLLSAKSSSGFEAFHSFSFTVYPRGTLPNQVAQGEEGKPAPAPGPAPGGEPLPQPQPQLPAIASFNQPRPNQLDLPGEAYHVSGGLGSPMLVLSGNQLAVLADDGITLKQTRELPRKYSAIGAREDYYVAISREEGIVELLTKDTLEAFGTTRVQANVLRDLVLHPTLAVSYIGVSRSGVNFIMLDEQTGELRQNEEWYGDYMAIDVNGQALVTGYDESFEVGQRLLINPDRIHVVPEFDSINVLIRYQIDEEGRPVLVDYRDGAGGGGRGIALSPDGQRVTYLSHTGFPRGSGNLGGWKATDLEVVPAMYNTSEGGSTKALAYHPMLPIVASPGEGGVVFFHRDTGGAQPDRLADGAQVLPGVTYDQVYFSPDGRSVILGGLSRGRRVLVALPLRFSAIEQTVIDRGFIPPRPLDLPKIDPDAAPAVGRADAHDRALAQAEQWIAAHSAFADASEFNTDVRKNAARLLDDGKSFIYIFGSGLMKSGKHTAMAVSNGVVVSQELTAEQAALSQVAEFGATITEGRRFDADLPRMPVRLEDLKIDHQPGEEIAGQVTIQKRGWADRGRFALSLSYQFGDATRRSFHHIGEFLVNERTEQTFSFGHPDENLAEPKLVVGLLQLVIFTGPRNEPETQIISDPVLLITIVGPKP